MENVFVHLASQSRLPRLKKMWMAPFQLHENLIAKIDALGQAAAKGRRQTRPQTRQTPGEAGAQTHDRR
jgi:polyphosphate kinase